MGHIATSFVLYYKHITIVIDNHCKLQVYNRNNKWVQMIVTDDPKVMLQIVASLIEDSRDII